MSSNNSSRYVDKKKFDKRDVPQRTRSQTGIVATESTTNSPSDTDTSGTDTDVPPRRDSPPSTSAKQRATRKTRSLSNVAGRKGSRNRSPSTAAEDALASPGRPARQRFITLQRCESTFKLTSRRTATARSRPPDIGILAMEVYLPNMYVDLEDLEKYDGTSAGKYVDGFGQEQASVPSDLEDATSMAMTVVDQLMTKHDVDWNQIGYVQVGTNSTTDKSKSIFTFLMQLWTARGAESFDIEGVDNISGTYGGTAAFFNVLNWLESTAWDGRMGLAVATDITIYDRGRPRSLSGAAAVAILMGAHAPLIVEPGLRTNFAAHVYDLFKPIPDSQYPVSFPELRDEWYFRSMEDCYKKFCRKCEERGIFSRQTNRHSAHDFDAVVFQCPYVKVAELAFARLYYADYKRAPTEERNEYYPDLEGAQKHAGNESAFSSQNFVTEILQMTKKAFEKKAAPSLRIAQRVGNMGSAAVFVNLVSFLISDSVQELTRNRIGMFAHGSGVTASIFALEVGVDQDHLKMVVDGVEDLHDRLDSRRRITPDEFIDYIERREKFGYSSPFRPRDRPDKLRPGTWYLESIDSMHRRMYKQHGKISRLERTGRESFAQQRRAWKKILEDNSNGGEWTSTGPGNSGARYAPPNEEC